MSMSASLADIMWMTSVYYVLNDGYRRLNVIAEEIGAMLHGTLNNRLPLLAITVRDDASTSDVVRKLKSSEECDRWTIGADNDERQLILDSSVWCVWRCFIASSWRLVTITPCLYVAINMLWPILEHSENRIEVQRTVPTVHCRAHVLLSIENKSIRMLYYCVYKLRLMSVNPYSIKHYCVPIVAVTFDYFVFARTRRF